MLMAVLMCGFSWSITACSDDDDKKEKLGENQEPLDTDEAQTAWRWLCALTDADKLESNWASKSYEPTVGVASENNKNTRIVVVNDIDEARQQFASLAGVSVDELGVELTVNQSGVGRMTWTPSKQGAQNLAEVSVDTKLIPHLQKLIYCTSDQVGVNGILWDNVKGTAYYRFGDVVKDAQGYYWVCVRPSFAPDKGDSHWINIFNAKTGQNMPQEYIKDKWNKSWAGPNTTILLPTQLPYSREHIYNLSNLVWALLDIPAYMDACVKNQGKGLGGFDYNYQGERFLMRVADYWSDPKFDIWNKLFGHSYNDFQNSISGLNFFYQGYSWRMGDNATMWIYKSSSYQPKMTGKESNDEQKFNMNSGFDITRYAMSPNADIASYAQFPSENPLYDDMKGDGYWVVRYKRGDKLGTGKYSPYEKLGGCEDVYNYNKEVGSGVGEDYPQEIDDSININEIQALKVPTLGCVVGEDGKFYASAAIAKKLKTTAVAVVVYLGKKFVENNRAYPDMPHYNGLAISVERMNTMSFAKETTPDGVCFYECDDDWDFFPSVRNGLKATECFDTYQCKTGRHIGGHCNTSFVLSHLPVNNPNFSKWFIPSVGQWILALQQFGFKWDGKSNQFSNVGQAYQKWNETMTNAGVNFLPLRYITCTEKNATQYYTILLEDNRAEFRTNSKKNDFPHAHAFTAFVFDGGATDGSDLYDR